MLLGKSGTELSIIDPRMNEMDDPKQIWHSVVNVSSDGSKIRCCKEQYCLGIWNVRSMNQGKLAPILMDMNLG